MRSRHVVMRAAGTKLPEAAAARKTGSAGRH